MAYQPYLEISYQHQQRNEGRKTTSCSQVPARLQWLRKVCL